MSGTALKFVEIDKVFPTSEGGLKPMQMPSFGVKTRILIADADPVNTLIFFESLVLAGYEIVLTVTGTDAISELRKADHPPVAILDRKLPGMDVTEICQRARDADRNIFLILTGENPTTEEIVTGLESGADLYLPKSISPQELLAHVKVGVRTIDRQRALAEKLRLSVREWLRPEE
jgi:DNA-binding response OmpR family regulator